MSISLTSRRTRCGRRSGSGSAPRAGRWGFRRPRWRAAPGFRRATSTSSRRNKRHVGGSLLIRLAEALELDVAELSGEAEHRLIAERRRGAGRSGAAPASAARCAHDLVAQQPDAARPLRGCTGPIRGRSGNADDYADRLRSDPLLAQLLHRILSGITAIRSSAEILEDVADLDEAERGRFLAAISREARGLSEVARSLIGQFETDARGGAGCSPVRELDDLIFAQQQLLSGARGGGGRAARRDRGARAASARRRWSTRCAAGSASPCVRERRAAARCGGVSRAVPVRRRRRGGCGSRRAAGAGDACSSSWRGFTRELAAGEAIEREVLAPELSARIGAAAREPVRSARISPGRWSFPMRAFRAEAEAAALRHRGAAPDLQRRASSRWRTGW